MGKRQHTNVMARYGKSIMIKFEYRGELCRETLKIPPTKENLDFAQRKLSKIMLDIEKGVFDYAKEFPNSRTKTARMFSKPIPYIKDMLDQLFKDREASEAWSKSGLSAARCDIYNVLTPAFGEYRVDHVTPQIIEDWIRDHTAGNKRVNNLLNYLRPIFEDAKNNDYISKNPMKLIKPVKTLRNTSYNVTTYDVNPFKPGEIDTFLECAHEVHPQVGSLYQTAIWTGLRTGELLGLQWDNIDFEKRRIYVTGRQYRGKFTEGGKTKNAMRTVAILDGAYEALVAQKEHTRLKGNYVFYNPFSNKPWYDATVSREKAWVPTMQLAAENGIAYRNQYQTRHTYASYMLTLKEDDEWVMRQMGHANRDFFKDVYADWIDDLKPNMGAKANQLFAAIKAGEFKTKKRETSE